MKKSLKLTESAIMLALGFVLSLLKVLDMPFGGSVTAFSLLPVIVIAYRYGAKWGVLTGFTYSLLQLVMGLKTLSYATSVYAGLAIIAVDYIAAFTVLGLAGFFRKKIKDQGSALGLGAFFVCFLKYICHVFVGCTVWAGVSIPTSDGLVFSIIYNSAYMVPETLLTVVGAYFAGKVFSLTEERIKRVRLERTAMATLYSSIPVVLGVTVSFVMLFAMMQNEDGFDINLIFSADIYKWIPLAAIFMVGITASFAVKFIYKIKRI